MKRYCIDCQHYNEGGVCGNTKQMVGALWEACVDSGFELEEKKEDEKRCARCGKMLPLSSFHRNRKNADGHQAICKNCMRVYRREWDNKHRK